MNNNQQIRYTQEQLKNSSISCSKFRTLREFWSVGAQISYPDYFGGVYLDEEKNLVICLKDMSNQVKDYISEIISLDNVTFKQVKYSYKELYDEKSRIVQACFIDKSNPWHSTVSAVGISELLNSVNIYLNLNEKERESACKADTIRHNITSFENVQVLFSSFATPCSYVYPGSKLSSNISPDPSSSDTAYFSVGFWATYDNNPGIVTASHNTIKAGNMLKIGTVDFGVALTPYCNNGGTVDAVFVRRITPTFEPTTLVKDWNKTINSSAAFPIVCGAPIYAAGARTGAISGEIDDISFTVKYDFNSPSGEYTNIYDCVKTTAICNNGDSGGIVFGEDAVNGNTIAGTIMAKTGDGEMIFCKYENILSTLNISPIIL